MYDYNKTYFLTSDKPPGQAGGLDRFPYNGAVYTLHRDEKVLTAAEADAYRSKRGTAGGGITIAKIADIVVIREDSDIDAIADVLATKIWQTVEDGVWAGELAKGPAINVVGPFFMSVRQIIAEFLHFFFEVQPQAF